MSAVKKFLEENGIKVTPSLMSKLEELGVKDVQELEDLQEEDLKNTGMCVCVQCTYIILIYNRFC